MNKIIFSKNLQFKLNQKIFSPNLRLGFVLKMSLIFGKISASCPYKLCPYSKKKSGIDLRKKGAGKN